MLYEILGQSVLGVGDGDGNASVVGWNAMESKSRTEACSFCPKDLQSYRALVPVLSLPGKLFSQIITTKTQRLVGANQQGNFVASMRLSSTFNGPARERFHEPKRFR